MVCAGVERDRSVYVSAQRQPSSSYSRFLHLSLSAGIVVCLRVFRESEVEEERRRGGGGGGGGEGRGKVKARTHDAGSKLRLLLFVG